MTTPEAIAVGLTSVVIMGAGWAIALLGAILFLHVIGWKP
jgi:hypothetical protein